jgi:hypothetical protein
MKLWPVKPEGQLAPEQRGRPAGPLELNSA